MQLLSDGIINGIVTDAESETETGEISNKAGENESKEISDGKKTVARKECKDNIFSQKIINDKFKNEHYIHSNFDTTIWDREIHEVDEMPLTDLTDEATPLSKSKNKFLKDNQAMFLAC